jgi:cytochrome c oxidase subunit 2
MAVKLNYFALLSLVLSVLFSYQAFANTKLPASYQQCIACHGDKGQGNDALNAPAIAGQNADYILRQIQHYATDKRAKSDLAQPMIAIAKSVVNASDLQDLTAYIEQLPIQKIPNEISGDMKNGSRYYQAKCGACHGGEAQGNTTFKAPRLANQSVKYLQQQMTDFVTGKRGYSKDDKLGRQMAMMATTTKGKELNDILYFISMQTSK